METADSRRIPQTLTNAFYVFFFILQFQRWWKPDTWTSEFEFTSQNSSNSNIRDYSAHHSLHEVYQSTASPEGGANWALAVLIELKFSFLAMTNVKGPICRTKGQAYTSSVFRGGPNLDFWIRIFASQIRIFRESQKPDSNIVDFKKFDSDSRIKKKSSLWSWFWLASKFRGSAEREKKAKGCQWEWTRRCRQTTFLKSEVRLYSMFYVEYVEHV